jgi:hypothetical protein
MCPMAYVLCSWADSGVESNALAHAIAREVQLLALFVCQPLEPPWLRIFLSKLLQCPQLYIQNDDSKTSIHNPHQSLDILG